MAEIRIEMHKTMMMKSHRKRKKGDPPKVKQSRVKELSHSKPHSKRKFQLRRRMNLTQKRRRNLRRRNQLRSPISMLMSLIPMKVKRRRNKLLSSRRVIMKLES